MWYVFDYRVHNNVFVVTMHYFWVHAHRWYLVFWQPLSSVCVAARVCEFIFSNFRIHVLKTIVEIEERTCGISLRISQPASYPALDIHRDYRRDFITFHKNPCKPITERLLCPSCCGTHGVGWPVLSFGSGLCANPMASVNGGQSLPC